MHEPVPPSELLLERLLAAIGKTDAKGDERELILRNLEQIRRGTAIGLEIFNADLDQRVALARYLSLKVELRQMRAQLAPLAIPIWNAGLYDILAEHGSLSAAEREFRELMAPERIYRADEIEDATIRCYLTQATDYRKSFLRKFTIEPFLLYLHHIGVSATTERPLTHMMAALFDWLGVPQRHRPTANGIRTIVADVRRQTSGE